MSQEIVEAVRDIEREKGIESGTLVAALEDALLAAYKKMPGAARHAIVEIDELGDFRVFAVELPADIEGRLIEEARERKLEELEALEVETGERSHTLISDDDLDVDWSDVPEHLIKREDVTPENFGRIAAQTAKQVILQRIREAEREMKYEEYAGREGDIVTGIIQQTDARYTLLDLGRVEALLPQAEQVPGDRYDHGSRMKAYIVEVRKTAKGPQIVVSRTHPGLVRRLFELEVPELLDGVVEIKAVAREPGHRTKLAVASNDQNVDPVGACVGARGMRVRQVVNELRGEKVDIVPYSPDPPEFVMRALAPAKVREVRIHEDTGIAEVIVPDFQLSLAIGKEGQNARLAARLTGWRVDIKSESQLYEEEQNPVEEEWAAGEWITDEAGQMVWQPAEGGEAVSASDAGWGEVEGVAAPPAEAQEAEEKIDETISADTAEPVGVDAGEVAEEVVVESPAAATVVAEAGEGTDG